MSPLEILARQLDPQTVAQLGQQMGASPQQTQAATAGIVQTLLGAMAQNVQRDPSQAQRIESALDRDNHAALLDNLGGLAGLLGGGGGNARAANGMGILQHILGNRTGRVASQVSQSSGLNAGQVGQLMIMLAPLVMGALVFAQPLGTALQRYFTTDRGPGDLGIVGIERSESRLNPFGDPATVHRVTTRSS